MKRATMQEIADALNISRVTVWKVFNNYKGVSDSLKAEVLEKAKEMGYVKYKQLAATTTENNISSSSDDIQMTISVVVSRPESSVFWMNIIHQIAKELTKLNMNLMYTYLPSKIPTQSYILPNALTDGTVQGMIVLNVYDRDMSLMLNSLPIPKVFLDMVTSIPVESIHGDLFLIEGKSKISTITDYLIKNGRTEIGFIGDTEYARTNYERYEGFLEGLKQNHMTVNPEFCLTGKIGIETYAEEIHQFLDSLKQMPNAFVCASDYVASFVIQYLNSHNYKIPEDIAVSGFDSNTEYPGIANFLTTVFVNTKHLGKRLVHQLMFQEKQECQSLFVTYMHPDIIWGASTDI